MSKLISTLQICFDDETKAVLSELENKLDAITGSLGVPSALLGSTNPNGGLLVAMGEAANDTPELLELGQWVFEGQDPKWVSAAKDADNEVWLFQVPVKGLARNENDRYLLWYAQDGSKARFLCDLGSNENWQSSAINRETVNDVDYLSETTPEMQGIDACDIIIDEVGRNYSSNSNCLHAVVPQITDKDMQLIFIKNLSEVLIQRMHSMDRFSEDDYAIGCNNLMPWDIVIGQQFADVEDASEQDRQDEFAIVTGKRKKLSSPQHDHFDVLILSKANVCEESTKIGGWATIYHETNDTYRAITEAELPAFRAALEACYA
ncbi:hypothetical protein ACTXGL_02360 [Psychrobacter sp. T6-6]|uniref:hypothetical protein n=1 Tax=Psychrobacter sp. T6-6 TaxID=3457452 RepID=UPI003FCEE92E